MKPEQRVWKHRLKKPLDAIAGLEYERIELRTGANGMPDLVLAYQGRLTFIEIKFAEDTPGQVDLSGWRRGQRTWTRRWSRAGGRVLLFIGTPSMNYLIDAIRIADVDSVVTSHSSVIASWPGIGTPQIVKSAINVSQKRE